MKPDSLLSVQILNSNSFSKIFKFLFSGCNKIKEINSLKNSWNDDISELQMLQNY